jgi:release factor glutamine methyltransferase
VTVSSVLERARDTLSAAGIADARLDAELLLRHVTGWDAAALIVRSGEALPGATLRRFDDLVGQRALRRPIQHLTGIAHFWRHEFRVTPDVLIPRPETETLVRVALDLKPRRALELGVGSGCISAALLRELPSLEVVAVDVSAAALELARENLAALGVLDRVQLVLADGLADVSGAFDLVVSNPPYVESGALAGLAPELRHEPLLALDGGPDGLGAIRQLCAEAPARLERPGALVLELGMGQADVVAELLRAAGAAEVEAFDDLAGIPRVVLGRFAETG